MKAGELVALLLTFPTDAIVIAEWESTLNTITAEGVSLEETKNGRRIVIIDCDGGTCSGSTSKRVYYLDDEELV